MIKINNTYQWCCEECDGMPPCTCLSEWNRGCPHHGESGSFQFISADEVVPPVITRQWSIYDFIK